MPEESELAHFGKKGMKWGVRQSKGTTGVSRHGGAVIDRNDRIIKKTQQAQSGQKYQTSQKLGKAVLGAEGFKKYQDTKVSNLKEQNGRILSGKKTIADKIDMSLNVSLFDLAVSRRPVN